MLTRLLWFALVSVTLVGAQGLAQEKLKPGQKAKDSVPCNEFALPGKQVLGQSVGVEQCQIISEETVFNIKGHKFRRIEVRLSGAVEGWASTEKGSRANFFTDGPDFVFAQSGLTGPRARGIGRYEASTGHGMTLLLPEDPRHWNGKLYMTAPGGSYGSVRSLVPRDPKAKFNPLQNVNRYVTLMIDKGYAVAHTMRSADRVRGDLSVTLEDGTVLKNYSLSSHAGLLMSWTQLARNVVTQRLGARPKRIYFYGHSSGGFWGRLVNISRGQMSTATPSPCSTAFF